MLKTKLSINSKWIDLFFLLIALIILGFTFNRGFTFHDEGYILQAAERVLSGQVPYRDFHYIYTPLTIYLTTLAFKLFGVSILAERLLLLIISVLTVSVVILLFSKITHNPWIKGLAVVSYIAWGPSHINFIWPIIISLSFGLTSVYFIFIDYPFLAGFTASLAFLSKQNLGLAVIVSGLISLMWFRKKSIWDVIKFLSGVAIPILFVSSYLWKEHALFAFFDQFYHYTWRGKLVDEPLRLVFLEYGPFYKIVAKSFLYSLPLTSSILVLLLAIRKKQLHTFGSIALFTVLFFLLNAWPAADYTHIGPTLSLAGFNILLLSLLAIPPAYKKICWGICLGLSMVGIWSALFMGYYRWETPLVRTTHFLSEKRLKIFVDEKYANVIPQVIEYVNNHTNLGDPVFVYYNAPMFNFITDRSNPTRGLDMSSKILPSVYVPHILDDLSQKPPAVVITHWLEKEWVDTPIGRYVVENYIVDLRIQDISVWSKKESQQL